MKNCLPDEGGNGTIKTAQGYLFEGIVSDNARKRVGTYYLSTGTTVEGTFIGTELEGQYIIGYGSISDPSTRIQCEKIWEVTKEISNIESFECPVDKESIVEETEVILTDSNEETNETQPEADNNEEEKPTEFPPVSTDDPDSNEEENSTEITPVSPDGTDSNEEEKSTELPPVSPDETDSNEEEKTTELPPVSPDDLESDEEVETETMTNEMAYFMMIKLMLYCIQRVACM